MTSLLRRGGLTLVLAAIVAPLASAQDSAPVTRKRTMYEDLQLFSQVLNQLRVNHPDSLDSHDLIMSAIRGMVSAADPHSYVYAYYRLTPEKEKAYRERKMHPVPVNFSMIEGAPVVVSVAPGTQAARLDILPGDELVAVDGKPVPWESAGELEMALAGAKNSMVRLTLERLRSDGSRVQLERDVKRERAGEESAVVADFMLDSVTGYARLTSFESEKTADDLHDALSRLERAGMRRLVLDLRDNGGGLVEEAADVAGEFLPKGAVVYTQQGRKAEVTDTGRVGRSFWSREKRYPMVVMVNDGTASAAELVAGALQDHDRALIVGRPSFGKSLLMQGFPLTDGSVMMLVVGHVQTPCGRVIQRRYHGISRRDYYRLAGAARDTVGRPSCTTTGGRVVYGGGGIYPDVLLPEGAAMPLWLSRVYEDALNLKWIAGHVGSAAAAYPSLDALAASPKAAPGAVADFRRFAREQGLSIPDDGEAGERLDQAIVRWVALAKWHERGLYRIAAIQSADVERAVEAFGKAEGILK
ncbi:MAG: S41 family peptidase [Gemmatimonadaceae bacterium]